LGMFYKPILAALGPEFLFLDPRWAYNHSWACMGSPIDRLTCLDHSMGYFGRSIRHTHKTFSTRCIHTRGQGCLRLKSSGKATPAHNERFRVGVRPSSDCGLRPFGVAHGVGRREVKVVGGHFCRCPLQGHRWGWSSRVDLNCAPLQG
jgi:hypothetical protein